MHRYEELEKIYYKKKYKKFFLFFLTLVLIAIALFFFINGKNKKQENKVIFHPVKAKITQISANNEKNETNITKKKIIKKAIPNKLKVLKQKQELKFILPEINQTVEKIVFKQKEVNNTAVVKKTKEANTSKRQNNINLNNIHIEETSINNVNLLIKKFKSNPDYDLAIMISKIYFGRNDFKKAQIWALKANEIYPQKIDSWIIFADILIKEKKSQKAKEILNTYINSYGQNNIIEKKLRSINEE